MYTAEHLLELENTRGKTIDHQSSNEGGLCSTDTPEIKSEKQLPMTQTEEEGFKTNNLSNYTFLVLIEFYLVVLLK